MTKGLAPVMVLLAGCLWGTLGLFARHLTAAGLGSFELTLVRTGGACLACGLCLLPKPGLFRIRLRDLWCFLGTGIGSMLLFSVFYFLGLPSTSLAVATVLVYTAPSFVMLLSLWLFQERLTVKKLVSLGLAFGGCVLVSGLAGGGAAVTARGFALCLAAGFFYSLYSIFGKFAVNRGYEPMTLTFYSFFFAALGSAALSDFRVLGAALAAAPDTALWMLGTGVLTAFLPYALFSTGLRYLESSKASILTTSELVTETLIGSILYREKLTLLMLGGIVLILAAVLLLNLSPRRRAVRSAGRTTI